MTKKRQPRPADFELLDEDDQEKIKNVRRVIIDTALQNIDYYGNQIETGSAAFRANTLLTKLTRGAIVRDPVELLRLTGMSDDEIQTAGIKINDLIDTFIEEDPADA